MFTATFTFAKGEFDDAFYALDAEIAQIAEAMEALQTLITHPAHIAAKARQARWLKGYQVVVAGVLRVDGDGGITHPPARPPARPPGPALTRLNQQ